MSSLRMKSYCVCGAKMKAAITIPALAHLISTQAPLSQIIYQKFAMKMWLIRQEKTGIVWNWYFFRNNMANWVIGRSRKQLRPVYQMSHKKLLKYGLLHINNLISFSFNWQIYSFCFYNNFNITTAGDEDVPQGSCGRNDFVSAPRTVQ